MGVCFRVDKDKRSWKNRLQGDKDLQNIDSQGESRRCDDDNDDRH
jgi:hypothetical protein